MKFGGGPTSLAVEYTYMDVLGGFEWSVQDISVANVTGPGVSLRVDLSPSRMKWVDSYNTFQASKNTYLLDPAVRERFDVDVFQDRVAHPYDIFLDDFVASARALRVSAFLTHQWLDGNRYASAGFTASQVILTRRYSHAEETKVQQIWGIMPRIALQGIGQDLTPSQSIAFMRPRYSRSVRTSLGLALQDNVPHFFQTGKNPDDKTITRWRLQAGVEYLFKNSTDGAESYGAYVRLRSLVAHNEVSMSVSKLPSKNIQVGIGYSATFDWEELTYDKKKRAKKEQASPPAGTLR